MSIQRLERGLYPLAQLGDLLVGLAAAGLQLLQAIGVGIGLAGQDVGALAQFRGLGGVVTAVLLQQGQLGGLGGAVFGLGVQAGAQVGEGLGEVLGLGLPGRRGALLLVLAAELLLLELSHLALGGGLGFLQGRESGGLGAQDGQFFAQGAQLDRLILEQGALLLQLLLQLGQLRLVLAMLSVQPGEQLGHLLRVHGLDGCFHELPLSTHLTGLGDLSGLYYSPVFGSRVAGWPLIRLRTA